MSGVSKWRGFGSPAVKTLPDAANNVASKSECLVSNSLIREILIPFFDPPPTAWRRADPTWLPFREPDWAMEGRLTCRQMIEFSGIYGSDPCPARFQ
jgi:hypothetical protein